jgi:hypothetical protein
MWDDWFASNLTETGAAIYEALGSKGSLAGDPWRPDSAHSEYTFPVAILLEVVNPASMLLREAPGCGELYQGSRERQMRLKWV